jgi:6-phosphogluconolactonase
LKSARITLTYPVFNAATFVLFLVAGADKAEALKATLEGGPAEPTPARRIRPTTGRVVWMVDAAAASLLNG